MKATSFPEKGERNMSRMQILTEAEREEFASPPVFSSSERKRYFHIPSSLEAILATLRTETNQVL
jgi:hypothetical protein